jgi:hypothetical protein
MNTPENAEGAFRVALPAEEFDWEGGALLCPAGAFRLAPVCGLCQGDGRVRLSVALGVSPEELAEGYAVNVWVSCPDCGE